MPAPAFLRTGMDTPFRPAGLCPVLDDSHHGSLEEGSFLVADVATRDGSAEVRLALWKCAGCGMTLIGVGRTDARLDGPPGTGVHVQEFTWLEEET